MKCELVSVGTELLLGDILNTNSQYLSVRLAELGVGVYYHHTVGDNEDRLIATTKEALERSDMVLFTGGLGPTDDDITRETVAKVLELDMENDPSILAGIQLFYQNTGRIMPEINRKQANVPTGATVLENKNGTAPGLILRKEDKWVVLLPGPPKEMIPLFEEKVVPWILSKNEASVIYSETLRVVGVGESSIQEKLQSIFDRQTNPTVAPYAKTSETHLRVTAKAETLEAAKDMVAPVVEEIENILGDSIYAKGNHSLEETIVEFAKQKGLILATAESCTGGLLSSRITDVSGSSEVYHGSVISYSNELKMKLLGVSAETLRNYGAVSSETAMEMAKGVRILTGAHIGVSTTGIAGPNGGSPEKPVGLAYIGISTENETIAYKHFSMGNREKIKWNTSTRALDLLRRKMLE